MKNSIKHMLAFCDSNKERAYYADTDNYITVTGVVSYIKLSDDASALYIAFEDLSVDLSDNCFKSLLWKEMARSYLRLRMAPGI